MRNRLLILALAALLPTLAFAQPATPAAGDDEDVQFELSLRNFGFLSGAAYQCIPESERTAHDREVLRAYSGLVRLFGTDRAFFYAAAFGNGTTVKVDPAKCPEFLDKFQKATAVPGGRK